MAFDRKYSTSQQLANLESPGWAAQIAQSPLLWGGLAAAGFYSVIPSLPVYRDLAARYLCSHPVEYATTVLFFVGMAILVMKLFGIATEKTALAGDLLFAGDLPDTADVVLRALGG